MFVKGQVKIFCIRFMELPIDKLHKTALKGQCHKYWHCVDTLIEIILPQYRGSDQIRAHRDNLFAKRSIPMVCFTHMGINP